MDMEKCVAFLSAADIGSFTEAAKVLGYSQSGITRMIKALEQEFGFSLFTRGKNGVQLTENGRMMLPSIREMVRAGRVAEQISSDIRGIVTGSVTLGCYYSVSAIWMPGILMHFEKSFPGIAVRMQEGGNLDMAHWLSEKSVDLCVCAKPVNSTYRWISLYKDEIVAWLPENHPLAGEKAIPIRSLEKEAFIHTSPGQDTDQDRLIEEEQLHMNEKYTTRDGFTTYNMVEAGLGISFNQRLISRKWNGKVVQVPLTPPRYVELGIAVPADIEMSPASKRFIQFLMQEIRSCENQYAEDPDS
ncbi:MAG: LysR family transcriptional regulator [Eubacterium sp.]|nr:LysR family transcriptional regulator [Eubacterium sp.]